MGGNFGPTQQGMYPSGQRGNIQFYQWWKLAESSWKGKPGIRWGEWRVIKETRYDKYKVNLYINLMCKRQWPLKHFPPNSLHLLHLCLQRDIDSAIVWLFTTIVTKTNNLNFAIPLLTWKALASLIKCTYFL
jgi:hypothetical protein